MASPGYGNHFEKGVFSKNASFKSYGHLLTVSVPGNIQVPLSLLFQGRNTLKLFTRLTVGYMLPGTLLDIKQEARVLRQSLSIDIIDT